MHRLGFQPHDVSRAYELFRQARNVRSNIVFCTHFACAETLSQATAACNDTGVGSYLYSQNSHGRARRVRRNMERRTAIGYCDFRDWLWRWLPARGGEWHATDSKRAAGAVGWSGFRGHDQRRCNGPCGGHGRCHSRHLIRSNDTDRLTPIEDVGQGRNGHKRLSPLRSSVEQPTCGFSVG